MKGAELELRQPVGLGPAGATPEEVRATENYLREELSERTRDAYAFQWKAFETWCALRGLVAKPAQPGTVALYVGARAAAGIRPASLELALAAISQQHVRAGLESPRLNSLVRGVMHGIRATHGSAQTRKEPLLPQALRAIVGRLPPGKRASARDRALLLLGFAGAFRRSELVGLLIEDVSFSSEGLAVQLGRSKTDQEGWGALVNIPFGDDAETCPVGAVRAWLSALGLRSGPLFREVSRRGRIGREALTGRAVALIIKRHLLAVGLDPLKYAGHSLRRGFATAAAKHGKHRLSIAGQGRWKKLETVDRYIDAAKLELDNAAKGIGL